MTTGKKRFFALLGIGLLTAGMHASAADGQWLPTSPLFPELAAATAEAHSYLSWVGFESNDAPSLNMGMVGLGIDFPVYRRSLDGGGAWQFGVFGALQSQFNLDTSNQALINSDYFVGFPLSWRRDAWAARLRLFHQSSHLGDEFILSGQAPPRQDLSYEAVDLLLSHELRPGWRFYGGGAWVLRKQWDALGSLAAQLGTEYVAQRHGLLAGRWLAAVDLKWAEAFDRHPQTRGIAGLRWGGQEAGAPSVTLAAVASHGAVPFGQFFESKASFFGAVVYFSLR